MRCPPGRQRESRRTGSWPAAEYHARSKVAIDQSSTQSPSLSAGGKVPDQADGPLLQIVFGSHTMLGTAFRFVSVHSASNLNLLQLTILHRKTRTSAPKCELPLRLLLYLCFRLRH